MAVVGSVLLVISVWKSGGNEGETTIKQHSLPHHSSFVGGRLKLSQIYLNKQRERLPPPKLI